MIYLLISIIGLISIHKRNSITKFLFGLLLASSIGAFLVGRQHAWDVESVLIVLFISILLWILFYSYCRYSEIKSLSNYDVDHKNFAKFERYATYLCVLTFIIEIYVLYRVMGLMLLGMTSANAMHTNEAEQAAIYSSVIPHIFLTVCNFLSPIGYIMLSLHFYFLVQNNRRKAIACLLLSLVLVLHGLIGFSRSATVVYILTYLCILFFVLPILNKKTKKIIYTAGTFVISVAFILLLAISGNRFSDYYTKNSKNDAILDETSTPVLFSMIDYFTMWNENGIEFIRKRPLGLMFYGWYNTAGLPIIIDEKVFGNTKVNEQREKEVDEVIESYVGDIWYEFQGGIARLTYEWGYIGTVVFVLLFSRIMRHLSPSNGIVRFRDLLCLPLLLPLGLTFWCGIGIGGLAVQMGMVYAFIFYLLIKKRPRHA